ncbi:hypothetical protein B0H14DRAFT_3750049 [Mycena olivaceomarginata]|nr:hypothetical protein B0H14DRAFT_3750049 [Mycena olivaceomarginata]
MLDIIEDWAVDMKGWRICRIDRTTPPLECRHQMDVFQSAGDAPDAPQPFLQSTRSGGLGVNPTAVDTVIFYDRDGHRLPTLFGMVRLMQQYLSLRHRHCHFLCHFSTGDKRV